MTTNPSKGDDPSTYERAIDGQYGTPDLLATIADAYENAGKEFDALTRNDIASFDEFHIRGREATRELADRAGLESDMRVLDVGSGVGGPARTIAAEYDCNVVGVDLVGEYVDVATDLTERVGLGDCVTFHQGNALDLPFDDESFDTVWLQHVSMNVADKQELLTEVGRVLRSGGMLALYEICAGPAGSPHFPVPWADDDSLSFLASSDELATSAVECGFSERFWTDVTAESLEWFRGVLEAMASRPDDAPTPLGLDLLMGERTPVKIGNVVRNLEEDRIEVVQGVFERE